MRIELTESDQPIHLRLLAGQAKALAASGWVDLSPTWGEEWAIRAKTSVGAATIGDIELTITPKLPIRRLFFLIGYATNDRHWQTSDVGYGSGAGLLPAMAAAYARQLDRALGQGVLQGYHRVDAALPLVRGRVRAAEQMQRRFGIALPVEVAYDEFDIDIPENQILRHAASLLLRLPGVSADARRRLVHAAARLADVSPLRRGLVLPAWQPSRLNGRYQVALRLAELIAASVSLERSVGAMRASGFMIDLAGVFEAFLTLTLTDAWTSSIGGRVRPQERWHLDRAQSVTLRPDIVWYPPHSDLPGAVVDAKYKAERPSGFPNADIYQMLAYCTRLGLPVGHLVYAAGSEPARSHELHGGVRIVQHVIDLDAEPDAVLSQVSRLGASIAEDRRGNDVAS